jgi:hypothetical protein
VGRKADQLARVTQHRHEQVVVTDTDVDLGCAGEQEVDGPSPVVLVQHRPASGQLLLLRCLGQADQRPPGRPPTNGGRSRPTGSIVLLQSSCPPRRDQGTGSSMVAWPGLTWAWLDQLMRVRM